MPSSVLSKITACSVLVSVPSNDSALAAVTGTNSGRRCEPRIRTKSGTSSCLPTVNGSGSRRNRQPAVCPLACSRLHAVAKATSSVVSQTSSASANALRCAPSTCSSRLLNLTMLVLPLIVIWAVPSSAASGCAAIKRNKQRMILRPVRLQLPNRSFMPCHVTTTCGLNNVFGSLMS